MTLLLENAASAGTDIIKVRLIYWYRHNLHCGNHPDSLWQSCDYSPDCLHPGLAYNHSATLPVPVFLLFNVSFSICTAGSYLDQQLSVWVSLALYYTQTSQPMGSKSCENLHSILQHTLSLHNINILHVFSSYVSSILKPKAWSSLNHISLSLKIVTQVLTRSL